MDRDEKALDDLIQFDEEANEEEDRKRLDNWRKEQSKYIECSLCHLLFSRAEISDHSLCHEIEDGNDAFVEGKDKKKEDNSIFSAAYSFLVKQKNSIKDKGFFGSLQKNEPLFNQKGKQNYNANDYHIDDYNSNVQLNKIVRENEKEKLKAKDNNKWNENRKENDNVNHSKNKNENEKEEKGNDNNGHQWKVIKENDEQWIMNDKEKENVNKDGEWHINDDEKGNENDYPENPYPNANENADSYQNPNHHADDNDNDNGSEIEVFDNDIDDDIDDNDNAFQLYLNDLNLDLHINIEENIDELLSLLPSKRITSNSQIPKDNSCIICLGQYSVGTFSSLLPCAHLFHRDCIEKWLTSSRKCPICKFSITKKVLLENQ